MNTGFKTRLCKRIPNMIYYQMPGDRCECPGREPKDIGAVPFAVLNSRLCAVVAPSHAFKSKTEIKMSHHDEIKIDQTAVGNASAKLNLLADLFTGAGFGAQLDLNEHSLFGLVLILQECAATMDTVERAVGARNIARATAERRVN